MIRFVVALVLASCVASTLVGCAGAPSISANAADRARIGAVRIDPAIEIAPKPFYNGRAQAFAAIGGAVGAALKVEAAKDSLDAQSALLITMRDHHIDLGELLRAQFARAGEATTSLRFVADGVPVDGVVSMKVEIWGLGQTQGLSATLYPTLGVSATLKRPDGTIVWQKYQYVTPLKKENDEGHTLEEYVANPELLRKVFDTASGIVSRMLIADYRA
jgi:hypothetical protein